MLFEKKQNESTDFAEPYRMNAQSVLNGVRDMGNGVAVQ